MNRSTPPQGQSGISIASPTHLLDVGQVATGYHLLVSSGRLGEAVEKFWDEHIEMKWADGREFRGLGTCATMISSALTRAEPVSIVFGEPVLARDHFLISVYSTQRMLSNGQLFESRRIYNHCVRSGCIVEIGEHLESLHLINPAHPHNQASESAPGAIPSDPYLREHIPWAKALQWLGHRGV